MSTESQNDELKMRRALGLSSGSSQHTPQQRPDQARARHRFVQDGGVPVVMLGQKAEPETAALRERITALEANLEHERQAHAMSLRALKDQESQGTALQTRLAHADLAHREALEQERRMRVAAQEALQEALAAIPARRNSRTTPVPPAPEPVFAVSRNAAPAPEQAAALDVQPQQKRGRGRPRSTTPPEPKPVRWWTPSYRSKSKG